MVPQINWQEPLQGFDFYFNSDGYYFDQKLAEHVIVYVENNFKLCKGQFAGHYITLEIWQKKLLGHLFGWKSKETDLRRFRKVFIYVPRKNGKTTLTAIIGNLLFFADDEYGSEVYCLAGDTAQASLVFNEAANMIRQNDELAEDIRIFEGYKSMKFPTTMSYWRVLSSVGSTKHGLNPHGYIIDELHVIKKYDLIEAMETGVGMRRQPLGVYLTTADHYGDSPCNKMLEYAEKIRDKKILDPTFLPLIYSADSEKDNWESEETWKKVNPNLGVTLNMEYLRQQYHLAKNDPIYENTFKRLHLDMQTKEIFTWMDMSAWDKCTGSINDIKELEGQECFAAMDLSSSIDITAFVLYFPIKKAVLPFFWVPKKTAKQRIEYTVWSEKGLIEITENDVIDYDKIRIKINELANKYKIKAIAYDSWNASQIANKLGDVDGFNMVEFRQGYKSMTEPTKTLYQNVILGELEHFNNPVLRWMASNANVKEGEGSVLKLIKPSKDSPLKIDGIIALIMAFALILMEKEEESSFLEQNEDNFDDIMKEIYG